MPMNTSRMLAVSLIAMFAVLAVSVSLVSDESDAALGTFTGGENRSTPTNPYTEIDCDISDLEDNFGFDTYEHIYYVELGSRFDITGRDPNSEFQGYDSSRMTLANVNGEWDSTSFWGFFTNTGQAAIGTTEDFAVIFEVVCNNDTKVESISVSGASSGTYTYGYYTDGSHANGDKDLLIYTTPRYNASPAPTATVTVDQLSGFDVVGYRLGISASGLVPHLHLYPKGIGTATFLIEATDGGGASMVLTVQSNEYLKGTLTFSANGGSGGPTEIEDYSYSGTFYHDIPEGEPTRPGYEFAGWSPDRYASEPEYTFDASGDTDDRYRTSERSATLYAVWKAVEQTYTASLVYDANGGSDPPARQTDSMTGTAPSGSKTFLVTDGVPTRAGYVCSGWSTDPGAQSATFHAGDSVSVAYGSSITLYAVWEQASISLSGTPPTHGVVGTSWSYTPTTSVEGCILSVSGASWLMVSNGSVVGTPTSTGTFEITITAQKDGYQSGTQTFTVQVLSSLSFESSPEGGAIIYAV